MVEKSKEIKLREELNDTDELLLSDDQEMRKEAEEEKVILKKISLLEEELKFLLIPKDEEDERNAIIEIRAGTGYEEEAFAHDLLRMYSKFSELH